jgi:hypothetical protein
MAQGFFYTGEEGNLATRRKLYEMMQRQGTSTEPIRHWTQGLARALTGVTGVLGMDKADAEQKRVDQDAMAGILGTSRPDTVSGSTGMEAAAPAGASPASATPSGDFPASLITSESGGNWSAQNAARGAGGQVGHFGRLQFGQARLQEAAAAGAIPQGTTPQQFMASPELQQRAERWHFGDIDAKIRANGLDRMIGQSINGVPITMDGMRAVAHLGGSGGLQRFIQSGGRYNPADANGTNLLNYLQRHAPRSQASRPQPQASPQAAPVQLPAQPSAAAVVDQMWNNRQQFDYGAARPAPADTLDGGDGSDPAPMIDGRNLPPDTAQPAMGRPAMSPAEAFGSMPLPAPAMSPVEAERAALQTGPTSLNLAAREALMRGAPRMAPSVDDMMAGQQVQQPMQAPMPVPRPEMAVAQAPMPQPRPNLEPPAGAQQAAARQQIAGMMGLNERDRLMMLRDEQSLAPGEADTLRAGLGGQAPQAAAPSANPIARLREMVMGGGSASPAAQAPAQVQSPSAAPAAAPAGAPAAAPGDQRARLMQVIMNPNVSPTVRQGAMMALQQMQPRAPITVAPGASLIDPVTHRPIFTAPDRPTDAGRDYLDYEREERAAGRPVLSRFEWGQQRRRAQANSVNVNTTETGDNAFNTETAKKQAAMFSDLVTDGGAARQDAARIAELRRLGDRIGTGAGANLQAIAAQYGLKLGDNVSEIEAFQAIVNQLVPQQRPAGSGAMSDRDVQLFKNSLPSLINTPGGNAILFDTMQGIAEYRQQQAQIAAEAQTGAIPRAEAIRRLNAIPDPLKAFRERMTSGGQPAAAPQPSASGAPRRIASQDEFNALPSGAEFIAPDGTRRRKP